MGLESITGRQQQRLKLLTPNPILWLASRHRWQRMPVWIVAILLISSAAIFTALGVPWVLWLRSYLAGALTLVLYLSVASQAGRFFVEARRNGLLELLLATPLTAGQIVQGQWRALLRLFATPLVICFLAQWLGAYAVQQAALGTFRRTPAVVTGTNATTTNAPVITSTIRSGTATTTVSFTIIAPAATGLGTGITFLANLCALSWFGMWMGLTSKNTNAATLKTITFVQIIPWFVITFASGMIIPLMVLPRVISRAPSLSSQSMLWYSLLTSGVGMLLALGKDAGFFFLARQKLYSEFREMATCTVEPIRLQFAPPPSLPDAPPIIGQG